LGSLQVPSALGVELSGAIAVVGDLVVTTLIDGTLVALGREDGEIVGTTDLGGGANGWLAALDGRLVIPVGKADPPSLLTLGLEAP
jgi:hypothetical protein